MENTSARHGRRSSTASAGAEYEELNERCVHLIGSYMPPDSLSRFRNIDLFHRRKLKSTVVDALVASTSARATVALGKIAEKGNAGAIAAVSARVEDANWDVRRAALDALPKIAEKGDAGAIAAVSARLEDADWYVRSAAVDALPKIAEKGDAGANAAVCVSLSVLFGVLFKRDQQRHV